MRWRTRRRRPDRLRAARRRRDHALAIVLLSVAAVSPGAAQSLYVSPEGGWSERRGLALGARVGSELVRGLEVVGQGLVFFPDEDALGDPGVDVRRSAWQVAGNVLYVFDPARAISPYVGAGVRYGRATLTIVVDDLRARDRATGIDPHLLGGVRLPRLPASPFVEVRGGDGAWTMTFGGRWLLRPR